MDLLEWSDSAGDSTSKPGPFSSVQTTTVRGGGGTASYDVEQNSTVSPTGWSGSGRASTFASLPEVEFGTAFAEAESAMDIEFRVTEPMFYRFAGSLSGDSDGGSFAVISFGGPDVEWVLDSDGLAGPRVGTRSGLLSPGGSYFFRALAFHDSASVTNSGTGATFNFEFGLSDQAPVPEPATLLLFSTGAAFAGRTAWRRRREQSKTGGFYSQA